MVSRDECVLELAVLIGLVWIVAPATKQSGMGGKSDFTTEAKLTGPSQYDLIPKGAPSVSLGTQLIV